MHVFNLNLPKESSTTGLNGQFLHFQLLIDVLLRLQSSSTDRKDFLAFCQANYADNRYELEIVEEFETNYSSHRAIWWYTRESLVYRVLNKALRTNDIDVLFLMRFFIQDIENQLRSNQYSSSIRVYRSQLISKTELDLLRNSIGQLICMNSFLSTSLNRQRALAFLQSSKDYQSILFIIDADPSLKGIRSFSQITEQSYFPEEDEILFMVGTIFHLVAIDHDENDLWIIRMNLCSNEQHQLNEVFNYMRKEYGDNQTNLLSFGKLLWTMGKYSQAEKYFRQLLNQLSENDPLRSYCYRALGNVTDDQGNYDESLVWHFKAIDLMEKNDPMLAESYNSIACVYDHQDDWRQALKFYKKALNRSKEIYGDEHLTIAVCLNNIACIYAEQGENTRALEYYERVLDIRKKFLPVNHADLGASYNNIGEIYRRMHRYESAIEYLNIAKDIYHLSVRSDHPDQAEVLMNLGLVYQSQGDRQRALDYFTNSSTIYHQVLPSHHPSVRKIDQLKTFSE